MAQGVDYNWSETTRVPARTLSALFFKRAGSFLADVGLDSIEVLARILDVPLGDCGDSSNRGRMLLQKWACKPDTTVYVLYKKLLEINRQDIIDLLKEELIDKFVLEICMSEERKCDDILLTVCVRGKDLMTDVFQKIPELSGIKRERIKCTMEEPPDDFFHCHASKLKGRQVKLAILTDQHGREVRSEPISGNLKKSKRMAIVSMPVTPEANNIAIWCNAGSASQKKREHLTNMSPEPTSNPKDSDSEKIEDNNNLAVGDHKSNNNCVNLTSTLASGASEESLRNLSLHSYESTV